MELRQLRYFLAVARTLNFSRAAEEVHIAQPPLSRQIAKLEAELGVALFTRGPRGLALTSAGAFFQERAAEILMRVERTRVDTAAFAARRTRPFRLAFDISVLYGRSPVTFRFLRTTYPELDFEFIAMPTVAHAAALRNGQIDFSVGRVVAHDDQLEEVIVRREAFVLALPLDHPGWRGAGQAMRLADVQGDAVIMYGLRGTGRARDPVARFFDAVDFTPTRQIAIDDLPAALGLVAAGVGVCVVPQVAQRIRAGDLAYAPLAEEGAEAPVVLSTLRGANRAMMERILAELARLNAAEPLA